MLKLLKIFGISVLSLSLSTPTTFAEGSSAPSVQFVKKTTPAPFDGYLFAPEAEQKAREGLLERDQYKSLYESSQRIIKLMEGNESLYEQRLENFKVRNDDLSVKLQQATDASFWKNTLYFGLGVLITGAIAIGIAQGSK